MATNQMTDGSKPNSSTGFPTSRYIHLNVGGVPYMTSLETLTRYQDSMLAHMFTQENIPLARDELGRFMIDRDGALFRYIVNFLRDGKLALPGNFDEIDQLMVEARFYQLDNLMEKLGCRLNVGGVSYTTIRRVLMKAKGSLLADWFSQPLVPLEKDQNGRCFIDRDGDTFQYILNFLEDEDPRWPQRFRRFREVEEEAQYFKIPAMANAFNVRLVVGGVALNTTREVLTRYRGSLLEDWFSQTPIPLEVDQKGRYIIQGDGQVFRSILDLLTTAVRRTRKLNTVGVGLVQSVRSEHSNIRLLEELKRYELHQLVNNLLRGRYPDH